MIDTTVCMPWRPTPDRIAAHDRVRAFWAHHGFRVIEADADPAQPFSISASRNAAVARASTEKVIVADADTIPDIGALWASLDGDCGGVTWPFESYRHIPGAWAARSDLLAAPVDLSYRNSTGGLLVTRRSHYWELGGMDERFHPVWGYEDNAFHLVVRTLSQVHRRPGIIFSFNHTAARDTSVDNPNRHRMRLYLFAQEQPLIMRALIKR